MSDHDTPRRRSWLSFTEIFFFIQMAWWCFWFGVMVVIGSEIYLTFAGAPRPDWLDPLETVYGVVWKITKTVVANAFSPAADKAPPVDPRCAVALVQFNSDGSEARRLSLNAKSLTAASDVVTARNVTWQKVQIAGYEGWAIKSDLDERRSHAECQ
ncbi:hypothetical protein [Bradyrhizobium genosp. A]|uniref:hypothetical protein n=1 Tax=Bradyrhizobium genosp. A TaxID=83626 RepID=UPI003CE849EE